MRFNLVMLLLLLFPPLIAAQDAASPVKAETLIQSTTSWDGAPYTTYPKGQPQLSVLKVTIPAHTAMPWHSHPTPNAGYILSGELTIETRDGVKKHFVAGQAVTETVHTVHRGVTGAKPAVLIVFYAGIPGMPLSEKSAHQSETGAP
jgi:quercetin dioxygenase-like cupin family protein